MKVCADVAEGVGDRRICSENEREAAEPGEADNKGGEVGYEWIAGRGVATPSALASFARRCGGKGARGGAHEGVDTASTGDEEWSLFCIDMAVGLRERLYGKSGSKLLMIEHGYDCPV